MSFLNLCQAVRLVCNTADVAVSINNAFQFPGQNTTRKTLATAMDIFLVGVGITEWGASAKGCSFKTLGTIKKVEAFARLVDIPIKLFEPSERHVGTPENWLKKCFQSNLAFFRAGAEASCYEAREYLAMSPEQLKMVRVAVYEYGSDSSTEPPKVIGYQEVTLEEAQQMRIQAEQATAFFCLAEIGLNYEIIHKVYSLLAARLMNSAPPEQRNEIEQISEFDPFDLVSLNFIPEELHNDEIFSKYICPITKVPIRHPICDKNGITLYEKSNIVQALRNDRRSPVTRAPHQISELIPKPALQALIDDRLKFHVERLRAFVRARAPINNIPLKSGADIENPTHNH